VPLAKYFTGLQAYIIEKSVVNFVNREKEEIE
jgi:hypothetical protein